MSEYEECKEKVLDVIDSLSADIIGVSRKIHEFSEYGTMEYKSSGLLISKLRQHGFEIGTPEVEPGMERWKEGLRTAIKATYRGESERPTVGINAEYDALPQGHGCGHNIIAATALGASIGVSKVVPSLHGSLVFLGSPAEEAYVDNATTKPVMLCEYRKLDACTYVHPGTEWKINVNPIYDKYNMYSDSWKFVFKGTVGHGSDEMSISNAQRAAILTMIAIDGLHIVPYCDHVITGRGLVDFRDHEPYYFSKGGSVDTCEIGIHVGQPTKEAKERVLERVKNCASCAALATDTVVEFIQYAPDCEAEITNVPLARAFKECFEELNVKIEEATPSMSPGSTDFGNVSRVTPSTSATIKMGEGFGLHTLEAVKAAASDEGDRAVIVGAKAMALLALKLFTDPRLVESARSDFTHYRPPPLTRPMMM